MNLEINLKSMFRSMIFGLGVCALSSSTVYATSDAIYAQLSSLVTQIPDDGLVEMEYVNEYSGLILKNRKVMIKKAGIYHILVTGQLGSVAFAPPGTVNFWLNHNKKKIPNTEVKRYIANRFERDAATTHTILSLNEGDTISVGLSSSADNLGLIASPASDSESATPSIIFSMFKIDK